MERGSPIARLVVPHHPVRVSAARARRTERLAEELLRERPELRGRPMFDPLRIRSFRPGGVLHLDDLGGISQLASDVPSTFLQDRARLRATDGDLVASCTAKDPDFEIYCSERLGLGQVTWHHPVPARDPRHVALACWTDRSVRNSLVEALRSERLVAIHPHIGNASVWALALLLHKKSRMPLGVVAPPPELCQCVNDKLWFVDTVTRMFGRRLVPRSLWVENRSSLAHAVRQLSERATHLVIKTPDAAGGSGNRVLESARYRGRPLGEIRRELDEVLAELPMGTEERLLVSRWEDSVLHSPSAQLWIPPETEGEPVVEGIFEQSMIGPTGQFVGCAPADLPALLLEELADRSWLLGRTFQRLGYVGRCSFDLILIGEDLDHCRVEFIECNGRWGGTSTPMTLMNRLVGDWRTRPYAVRRCTVPGLDRLRFADLLDVFEDDLFDASTGRGELVLFNPDCLRAMSGIDVLVMADDWQTAHRRLTEEIPRRLAQRVTRQHLRSGRAAP